MILLLLCNAFFYFMTYEHWLVSIIWLYQGRMDLMMYCWSSEVVGSQIGEVDNDCGSRGGLAGQSLSVTPWVDDDAISHNYPSGPNHRGPKITAEGPGFLQYPNMISLSILRCEIKLQKGTTANVESLGLITA